VLEATDGLEYLVMLTRLAIGIIPRRIQFFKQRILSIESLLRLCLCEVITSLARLKVHSIPEAITGIVLLKKMQSREPLFGFFEEAYAIANVMPITAH
jgi:hypothetical protein